MFLDGAPLCLGWISPRRRKGIIQCSFKTLNRLKKNFFHGYHIYQRRRRDGRQLSIWAGRSDGSPAVRPGRDWALGRVIQKKFRSLFFPPRPAGSTPRNRRRHGSPLHSNQKTAQPSPSPTCRTARGRRSHGQNHRSREGKENLSTGSFSGALSTGPKGKDQGRMVGTKVGKNFLGRGR